MIPCSNFSQDLFRYQNWTFFPDSNVKVGKNVSSYFREGCLSIHLPKKTVAETDKEILPSKCNAPNRSTNYPLTSLAHLKH